MSAEGRRVVLIIARRGERNTTRLAHALDQLERGGYELASVVDPEQYLEALRMIVDGLADLVVITAAEDFPLVQHVADLNGGGDRRARPVLRPTGLPPVQASPRDGRRPQLVERSGETPAEQRTEQARSATPPRDRRTHVIRRTA